jgi:glycosyltransferase involved in cell wall biosynthesis
MRILCIDGPYFLEALRLLGHETLSVGTSGGLDVILDRFLSLKGLQDILASRDFVPDLVLWSDTCQPPSVGGLEVLPWPTIAYSIDHYMNPWHIPYSAAFDLALVAQRDYLPLFVREHPRPALWLPLFCDPAHDQDPGSPRDIPVSFVGTLDSPANPARRPFLDAFKRLAPLVAATGDYRPIFARSRLVLNQSAAGELNLRIFQAMACGAAVLTEDAGNGLRDLFTPGEHLLVYERGNAAHAAARALDALAGKDLQAVALAGRKEVLGLHTVTDRARAILGEARKLLSGKAHRVRLANLGDIQVRMATAYSILALDEKLALPERLRSFYLDQALELRK